MASIGGSEIVALEIAECFKKNNYIVDIVANYIGSPVADIVKNSGVNLLTTDDLPDPFKYDIVWAQHQVLPILVDHYIDNFNNKTYFVFAHLSPYEHLETFGLYTERLLANKIFANSKETFNHLCDLGLPTNISNILFNASPAEFFHEKTANEESLKNIMLVSNHPPEEILDAMEILKNEYLLNVTNIGVRGSTERLTPKMIENAHAVVTIGKTVQYAIVGDTPVYCYDHFGGIGWLSVNNYKKAEEFNYSGRCCLRKISAREIVEEIIVGYEKAREDIHKIRREVLSKYCLDSYISAIIKESQENINTRFIGLEDRQKIRSESEIVKSIKQYYNAYNELSVYHNNLLKKINDLSSQNDHLLSDNSINMEKYNVLLSSYNKLESRYLKYKNTFFKKLARTIKKIYNKNVD
ncbi:hypothetical protein A9G23_09995 [Gilliamella sp. App4-10]|nr:hypothetical protein A9G23_09995 [Gilliamella apicola]